ncbi:BQ2448_4726 [Microbotryum intermedium]|uniref:BQ2448_4726 protein n=1 Tax=Microbotryum intermedium TaxID=269621 RepID=A0A238FDY4_9BASI|nr:BQ2448_4726 [Microbotryum intermedium]
MMGVPLKSLLDRRNYHGFLLRDVASFYKFHEIIWQAVGESTWLELDAYLNAMEKRRTLSVQHLWFDPSLNLFSARVRKGWSESLGTMARFEFDIYTILESTGFYMHLMRQDFIELFNAKHPDLDPPPRLSDDLGIRLLPFGGLPTFQPDRADYFKRAHGDRN